MRSTTYPFCAPAAEPGDDGSIRSGMQWVDFNGRFNRLHLIVKGTSGRNGKITWGSGTRTYTPAELERGINLAAEFIQNPFSQAFQAVDEAVAKKQAYETRQIKSEFHGAAGKADMEGTVRRTEAERAPLVAAIRDAFQPVDHRLTIELD